MPKKKKVPLKKKKGTVLGQQLIAAIQECIEAERKNKKMTEFWKDIPFFEGYQISNKGRVKSIARKIGKRKVSESIKKVSKDSRGKDKVTLYKEGKPHTVRISTLMSAVWP